MPSVDYRIPDGLSWQEITSVLTQALASGRAIGLEITIYNPELDEGRTAGRNLTNMLVSVLRRHAALSAERP